MLLGYIGDATDVQSPGGCDVVESEGCDEDEDGMILDYVGDEFWSGPDRGGGTEMENSRPQEEIDQLLKPLWDMLAATEEAFETET